MHDLEVIYEDSKLIAINKRSGPITERSPFEQDTVEDAVHAHLSTKRKKPFVGVTHRLDRVTSGVLLFAKNKSTLVALNSAFERRLVQKTYLALTETPPKSKKGTLEHHLVVDKKQKKALIYEHKTPESKSALLKYKVLGTTEQGTLLEVFPATGRFHQIRAQLAHIGSPIIGDHKYGSRASHASGQICLHAFRLTLKEQIGELPQEFVAPLPEHGAWLESNGLVTFD